MPNDDSFPITIDVEETHVGKVLRLLDRTPGVVNIHLRMNKDRLPGGPVVAKALALTAPKPPRADKGSGNMNDIVGQSLTRGSLHYKILGEILQRHGYSANSLYKALGEMQTKKLVKKVAAGTYRLTEKGDKKYSIQPQDRRPGPWKRLGGPDNTRGLRSFVLTRLAVGEKSHKDLMELIQTAGYVKNNIYSTVPKLMQEGLVKKTHDVYELTETGREITSRLMTAPAPEHQNGNNGETT